MQIKDYIQGNKHGKEANRLEREAMNDAFLKDALQGFDAVSGNHTEIIERLEKKIGSPTGVRSNSRRLLYFVSVAASVLLLIGFGIYFIWDNKEQKSVIAMVQTNDSGEMTSLLPELAPPVSVNADQIEISKPANDAEIQIDKKIQTPHQPENTKPPIPAITEDDLQVVISEDAQDQILANAIAPPVSKEDEKAEDMDLAAEAEAEYAVARRSIQSPARARERAAEATISPTTFGEKEFEAYCLKNAVKNICDSDTISVRVSFDIDPTGKPTNIKCDQYTCEDAKKEIERLLDKSPAWTDVNRQITMDIKW